MDRFFDRQMRVMVKHVGRITWWFGEGGGWGGKGCPVEDVSLGLPGWVAEGDISVTLWKIGAALWWVHQTVRFLASSWLRTLLWSQAYPCSQHGKHCEWVVTWMSHLKESEAQEVGSASCWAVGCSFTVWVDLQSLRCKGIPLEQGVLPWVWASSVFDSLFLLSWFAACDCWYKDKASWKFLSYS